MHFKFLFYFILCFLLIIKGYSTAISEDKFYDSAWMKQHHGSAKLQNFLRVVTDITEITSNTTFCPLCQTAFNLVYASAKRGEPLPLIKMKMVGLCIATKIQTNQVCTGIMDTFLPVIVEAFRLTPTSTKEICSMIFGEVCPPVNSSIHEWKIKLPDVDKPAVKEEELPKAGDPILKVLQLNDIHLDADYVEDSNGNCIEPLCCRSFSSIKKQVMFPAGRWGHYRCDPPEKMVESMLQSIAKQHPDLDYIMLLGDFPPHDIWNETQQKILNSIDQTISMIKKVFPNTLVLPNVGNHDVTPIGSFAPPWVTNPKFSSNWLYQKLYELWNNWLPVSEKTTILLGGYYSILVRPGLRIISLNTNFCNIFNWWLYVNSTDPADQLEWLVEILQKAETDKEKVHIIGHIPPGSFDCLKVWSRNYYNIVNRYENIITAQFFGHTHLDEFELFYDINNASRSVSTGYIAPSVSPYIGYNPAYRIYYIDANTTREVIDHETWVMDLDNANNEFYKSPTWVKSYSAKETYHMSSLRPTEWNKLIDIMWKDSKMFDVFYRNYHRDSPVSARSNEKQKKQILCNLKNAKSHDRNKCTDFQTS